MAQEEEKKRFSFSEYAWKQFKKNKPAYISLYVLLALVLIAIIAPILANNQPLYAKYKGQHLFPAFSTKNTYKFTNPNTGKEETLQLDITEWKQMELEAVIWAPVVYSPNKSDFLNANFVAPNGPQKFRNQNGQIVDMPARFKHWLGTNKRGEDVFSGVIHATRISLSIGVISMGIATIIGLFLGAMAGYFGDNTLYTSRGKFWLMLIGIFLAFYYSFMNRSFELQDAIGTSGTAFLGQLFLSLAMFIIILVLFNLIGTLLGKLPVLNKRVSISMDSYVSRLIEILISIPRLILIVSIAAVAKPSIVNLMIIIGLTSWTGIARFTRAEFLRIRSLEYIQAGQALGFKEARIIFKHALPNGMAPAFVAVAFGVASAILIESGLSFLGIGVPPDVVTWGSLLNSGREEFDAWWLVIFPGFAIFITVTVYNLLGEGLRDALDPRLKQ